MQTRRGFTLIELLVVIAIVAVLAVTLILTLNPAELLKQARDSNRISDLDTLNKALSLVQADIANPSFGTSATVYVSIPDSSTTCTNLGLPSLPAGYTYGCAPTSTLRNNNGTGWIPVNFTQISSGSPLSNLPVDPVNSTSTGQYYTYVPGGGWELTALMESDRYLRERTTSDGGDSFRYVETGSDLTLNPRRNLWGNTGDFESGIDGFEAYTTPIFSSTGAYGSKVGSKALYMDGGGTRRLPTPTLTAGRTYTLSFWAKGVSNFSTVNFSVQSGSGDQNCLTFNITLTASWQRYSRTCVLDVPKSTLYLATTGAPQWVLDGVQIQEGGE